METNSFDLRVDSDLRATNSNRNWCMDGTYTSCPKVFKISKNNQIFVIGTIIKNHTIPCVYALINRQNQRTFKVVFDELKKVV